ncbi:hypothetical protein JCM6882_004339 [Rhodosporidiobolus microsporus]
MGGGVVKEAAAMGVVGNVALRKGEWERSRFPLRIPPFDIHFPYPPSHPLRALLDTHGLNATGPYEPDLVLLVSREPLRMFLGEVFVLEEGEGEEEEEKEEERRREAKRLVFLAAPFITGYLSLRLAPIPQAHPSSADDPEFTCLLEAFLPPSPLAPYSQVSFSTNPSASLSPSATLSVPASSVLGGTDEGDVALFTAEGLRGVGETVRTWVEVNAQLEARLNDE